MGTRGAIGVRIDGQDKVTYNHFDSYPTGVGEEVFDVVRRRKSDERMKRQARGIVLIKNEDEVTDEIKAKIAKKVKPNLMVSTQSEEDLYCLMRNAQGHLDKYLDMGVMTDNSRFLLDSLFCEWAYIVNLDTGKLEVYRGFNKKPAHGRYGNILEEKPAHRDAEYYGVALIAEFSLNAIRSLTKKGVRKLCERIEQSIGFDEYGKEYPEEFPEGTTGIKELVAEFA